jgi:hypothetical protein
MQRKSWNICHQNKSRNKKENKSYRNSIKESYGFAKPESANKQVKTDRRSKITNFKIEEKNNCKMNRIYSIF